MLVWPCDQNVFGLQSTLMRNCPEVIQGDVTTSPTLLGVEPVEVSEITVDREVFRVLLGLLLPRLDKG